MKNILSRISLNFLLVLVSFSCTSAQPSYLSDKPAFVIYNKSGKQVSYSQMLNTLSGADVALFGEQHNDPISHWLELSLLKDLYKIKGEKLILGSEVWEADQQLIMNEFLASKHMTMESYAESSRQWKNFVTDYQPILAFAKDKGIDVIATNVPRRYASMVSAQGIEVLDSLSDQAKAFLPTLPLHINLEDEYYEEVAEFFKKMSMMKSTSVSNLVKAQALKDATMASNIVKYLKKGNSFFHFHGEFHSAKHSAIEYYIRYYNENLTVKTVSVISQEDVMKFSSSDSRADFNVVVPNDMSKSYVD